MIEITPKGAGASITEISALEQALSVRLPEAFQEFLEKTNAAIPENNQIMTASGLASVSKFLGISSSPEDDLRTAIDTYHGRIPEQMIPVALAGGGNLFCLDTGTGKIYFWDHELEAAEDEAPSMSNLFLAADSFAAFLGKLQKFDPAQIPANVTIISSSVKPGFSEKFKSYLKKT